MEAVCGVEMEIKTPYPKPLVDNKEYIKYIKSQPCCVCGQSPVDPDHLNHRGMGGGDTTEQDFSCVPLCRIHHTERHAKGIRAIYDTYRVDLWKDAHMYLRRYFCE